MNTQQLTELEALKDELKTMRDAFLESIEQICKHNRKQMTYAQIFNTLDIVFHSQSFMNCQFSKPRRKQILAAWNEENNGRLDINLSDHFYGDFEQFIKCVAKNYYVAGVGGTGEAKRLQKAFCSDN